MGVVPTFEAVVSQITTARSSRSRGIAEANISTLFLEVFDLKQRLQEFDDLSSTQQIKAAEAKAKSLAKKLRIAEKAQADAEAKAAMLEERAKALELSAAEAAEESREAAEAAAVAKKATATKKAR